MQHVLNVGHVILTECDVFIAKFTNSMEFIKFMQAESYTSIFTTLHQKLLHHIADLQLVWIDDVHDRVVDMHIVLEQSNDILHAVLSKFEHEVPDVLCSRIQHVALLNMHHSEQAELFGCLHKGMIHGMSKILVELAQLKKQKNKGITSYRRTAAAKQKAAERELIDKYETNSVEIY